MKPFCIRHYFKNNSLLNVINTHWYMFSIVIVIAREREKHIIPITKNISKTTTICHSSYLTFRILWTVSTTMLSHFLLNTRINFTVQISIYNNTRKVTCFVNTLLILPITICPMRPAFWSYRRIVVHLCGDYDLCTNTFLFRCNCFKFTLM